MTKFAIILILLGTATVLWQQTEAKPLFFLQKNFFVLTTRAPSSDSRSSSSSSSFSASPSGGLLSGSGGIISSKLGLFTGLLSGFGGGGGLGFANKFNAGTTTRRPRRPKKTTTTTEPNTVFTPDTTTQAVTTTTITSSTTNAPLTTGYSYASSTTTETLESTTTEATTIDVKPTVVAQRPAVIASAKEGESVASSNNVNSGFEVIYENKQGDDKQSGAALTSSIDTDARGGDVNAGGDAGSSSNVNSGYEVIYANKNDGSENGGEVTSIASNFGSIGGSIGVASGSIGGSASAGGFGSLESSLSLGGSSSLGGFGATSGTKTNSGTNSAEGGFEVIYTNNKDESDNVTPVKSVSSTASFGSGNVGGTISLAGVGGTKTANADFELTTRGGYSDDGYDYKKPQNTRLNEISSGNLSKKYLPAQLR
ncbi:uncharacterized protein LOC101461032 [Ceratitis capitata]|uniref:uncharacterized protein LOC101461032 n=1 Tax=Ceratitis capitata TaxID=7213 RepID=UPI000618854D|nr:uncharacterized protein LOC101461032 [Ceratitis capitata]